MTNKNQSQKLHSAPLHTMQLDEDDEDDEGLATLIPEIQETALLVEVCFCICKYIYALVYSGTHNTLTCAYLFLVAT